MNKNEIFAYFEENRCDANIAGMRRFGIIIENAFGISMPKIRALAQKIKKNNELAIELWNSKCHEARILATIVAEYDNFDKKILEKWVNEIYSWDICDQMAINLFDKAKEEHYDMAKEWAKREEEFVRRFGFVLMARLAVADKKAKNSKFIEFFELIKEKSTDERNFVKKAVNWAIRQMGKKNMELNRKCLELSNEILQINSKSANWIAKDAIRELTDSKIIERIIKNESKSNKQVK